MSYDEAAQIIIDVTQNPDRAWVDQHSLAIVLEAVCVVLRTRATPLKGLP